MNDIKSIVESLGMPAWVVIGDILKDQEFKQLLTPQEVSVLDNVRSNPNQIQGYREYFPNIVAKYYSWQVVNSTGIKKLTAETKKLADQVSASKSDLDDLSRNVQLTSGATALVAYSVTFAASADKHNANAIKMQWCYVISVFALLVMVALVFFLNLSDYDFFKAHIASDIQYNLSLAVFGLKAVLIFFFFQIVQFFRKNYNAEKHLEEVYRHRSDVLQSLHAVYNTIDDKVEKDKLLSAAALFAYERGETGYITTKEGAGSGETEGLIARFLK